MPTSVLTQFGPGHFGPLLTGPNWGKARTEMNLQFRPPGPKGVYRCIQQCGSGCVILLIFELLCRKTAVSQLVSVGPFLGKIDRHPAAQRLLKSRQTRLNMECTNSESGQSNVCTNMGTKISPFGPKWVNSRSEMFTQIGTRD
jgi:hypothetical protein